MAKAGSRKNLKNGKTHPVGFYYWLSGKRMSYDTADDMDDVLVKNGFVAVSPIRFDLTDMAFYEGT